MTKNPSNSMLRQRRAIAVAVSSLVLMAAASNSAFAQSNASGTVYGSVQPGAGITVVVQNVATGVKRTLTPDANGRFSFPGRPPGDYRILATFDQTTMDFETLEEARAGVIPISAGQTTNVELTNWLAP